VIRHDHISLSDKSHWADEIWGVSSLRAIGFTVYLDTAWDFVVFYVPTRV
jgi:hypothetical protein